MRHPFDLNSTELEAIDRGITTPLTDAEAAQVGGGVVAIPVHFSTTVSVEEGGSPPITTMALGEEGGTGSRWDWLWNRLRHPIVINPPSLLNPPPIATTLAVGEEGG